MKTAVVKFVKEIWWMETEIIHLTAEKGIYKDEIAVLLHFVFNQHVVNQLKKIENVWRSKTLNYKWGPYTISFFKQISWYKESSPNF